MRCLSANYVRNRFTLLFGAPILGQGRLIFGAPILGQGRLLFGAPILGQGRLLFGTPMLGQQGCYLTYLLGQISEERLYHPYSTPE